MHRWNFYLCWPPAPGVAFPEHKCGHALLSALSGSGHVLSAGQTTFPSPPPATFLPLPPSSIPRGGWGGVGGCLPDAHGCPSPPVSFTLSSRPSAVSLGTVTCWVAFQTPTWCPTGGGTGTRTGAEQKGGRCSGLLLLLRRLRFGSLRAITHGSLGALRHSASWAE